MAAKVATTGSVRKAKPFASKTSINSPYKKVWNTVVGEDMQFILHTIMEKFQQLGLKKVEIRIKSKDRKIKKSKKTSDAKEKECDRRGTDSGRETVKEGGAVEAVEGDTMEAVEGGTVEAAEGGTVEAVEGDTMEAVEGDTVVQTEKSGWTHSDLRKHLAIGINEVTRSLERNDLYLVFVCKSAKPEMITKHIIELSASRQVPACQLPRLSESVAPVLGLKSVMALGFKKSSDVFLEQVRAIVPRLPPLNVRWLPKGFENTKLSEDSLMAEDSGEQDDESKVSRKRKHARPEEVIDVTLQELQVKKIVPNPNKKRKIKNKKKVVNKK